MFPKDSIQLEMLFVFVRDLHCIVEKTQGVVWACGPEIESVAILAFK